MLTLSRRLLHIIKSTRAQFLGMAAVIAVGISLYIGFNTAFTNLEHSRDAFYADNIFADHYFNVVRAPEAMLKQINNISGINRVTGRIQKDIPLVKGSNERATVRLTSYPLPMDDQVNQVQLMSGRWFEQYPPGGGYEVIVDPGFFAANSLYPGKSLDIIAENHKYPVIVVGTATGPEFIYPMKDASTLVPDYETFGIMMIPHHQAQLLFNLPGQINQILIQFTPGADRDQVVNDIKKLLEPYGNLTDFPRKDQMSHAALNAELDGLDTMAGFLPVLFLGIAAAIQFILLRRMVRAQRTQIGILKALGYHNRQVIIHYSSYALIVGLLGAIIGLLLGMFFASFFSEMYGMFFKLPANIGGVNLRVIGVSILLAVSVSFLAGLSASKSIVSISPAESMRPLPPVHSNRSLLETWFLLWHKLDSSWKMAFRSISRNRFRTMVTVLGVSSAVSILVVSMASKDSTNYMLDQHFTREISYDYLLQFEQPVKDYELLNIEQIEGVRQVEGFFSLPVKIYFNDKSADDLLQGQDIDSNLKLPTNTNGEFISIPEEGIIISQKTAKKLGITVGDTITVETALHLGSKHTSNLRVTGINHQLFGVESYASVEQVNAIMHESALVTGAMLEIDNSIATIIEQELANMTGITSISSKQKERDNIFSLMDSTVYTVGIMIFFALLLGFVIIFNSVLLSFNERKQELTSLLTIGLTRREVAALMFKETIPQAIPGIIIGIPAGKVLTKALFHAVEFDMWIIPVIVYPSSYVWAALGGIVFILLGQLLASRGIKDLDTVELLKSVD